MKQIKIINSNVYIDECGTWIHASINDQLTLPNVRGTPMKSEYTMGILYYNLGNKINLFLHT